MNQQECFEKTIMVQFCGDSADPLSQSAVARAKTPEFEKASSVPLEFCLDVSTGVNTLVPSVHMKIARGLWLFSSPKFDINASS